MASVYNRGTKSAPNWWGKYKDETGNWRSVPTKMPTKAEAEQWVQAAELRVRNGQVGIIEKTDEERARAGVTLSALVDRFNVEYRPPKVKDIASYRVQTKSGMSTRVLPALGARRASSVTSDEIETLRDRLLDEDYAGGSVAWTMARLSKVYAWGIKKKVIDGTNPVSGVDYPEVASSIDYLSREEVTGLMAYLDGPDADLAGREVPQLRAMVTTAIYAGLRKGELMGLRWIDVSLDRSQLTVARSYTLAPKSGKPRHLPLHPELARVLRVWRDQCPKTDDGLVFPHFDVIDGWGMGCRTDMLHLPHYLAAAKAHVPSKPWHALRHTFASHFMMAGGNILTLQKLLGHASIEQTMIYAHLAPDFIAAEVSRMSFAATPAEVVDLDERRREKVQDGTIQLQEANA